ncbi:hypothetical protein [Glaciibacter sp. 2TAF33]|uniref:hypothetical protein n=1 Tax=Glaciibacter sp. 2TAF33 TaxID=3233015 RepID=UPI003F8FDB74
MPDVRIHAEVRKAVRYLIEAVQSQGQGEELVVTLIRESADLIKKRQPLGGALSEEQVSFLIDSGTFTAEEFAETAKRVARGDLAEAERKTLLGAVAASLSAAEVAVRLGVDVSRVRHHQAKGNLYAFIAGGKRRYPLWQFTDDPAQPVLPGLATIVEAFGDKHPASIKGFMSTPQEDLLVDGERLTPPEWLLQGGDPEALVDILDSFLQS